MMVTLQSLAVLWTAERTLSVSRLGTLVINDGRFFERVAGGASCTIATFERFMRFFRDPTNWTDRGIPMPARVLLDALPPHDAPNKTAAASQSGGNGAVLADQELSDSCGLSLPHERRAGVPTLTTGAATFFDDLTRVEA